MSNPEIPFQWFDIINLYTEDWKTALLKDEHCAIERALFCVWTTIDFHTLDAAVLLLVLTASLIFLWFNKHRPQEVETYKSSTLQTFKFTL